MHFRKILIPVDDSQHSRNALRHAAGLVKGQDAHVALLHCYGRIPMLVGGAAREELIAAYVKQSEKLLEPSVKLLREAGVEPVLLIKEGRPGEVIVDEAQKGGYELIVMGSRGLSDVEGALIGSTAHRVLHAAHCPVLMTR